MKNTKDQNWPNMPNNAGREESRDIGNILGLFKYIINSQKIIECQANDVIANIKEFKNLNFLTLTIKEKLNNSLNLKKITKIIKENKSSNNDELASIVSKEIELFPVDFTIADVNIAQECNKEIHKAQEKILITLIDCYLETSNSISLGRFWKDQDFRTIYVGVLLSKYAECYPQEKINIDHTIKEKFSFTISNIIKDHLITTKKQMEDANNKFIKNNNIFNTFVLNILKVIKFDQDKPLELIQEIITKQQTKTIFENTSIELNITEDKLKEELTILMLNYNKEDSFSQALLNNISNITSATPKYIKTLLKNLFISINALEIDALETKELPDVGNDQILKSFSQNLLNNIKNIISATPKYIKTLFKNLFISINASEIDALETKELSDVGNDQILKSLENNILNAKKHYLYQEILQLDEIETILNNIAKELNISEDVLFNKLIEILKNAPSFITDEIITNISEKLQQTKDDTKLQLTGFDLIFKNLIIGKMLDNPYPVIVDAQRTQIKNKLKKINLKYKNENYQTQNSEYDMNEDASKIEIDNDVNTNCSGEISNISDF